MRADKVTVIVGPPGTGKTTRLIQIVEEHLANGVPPWSIGFISFTKKGAEEGRTRASAKFNIPEDKLPHFKTIHAMAFRHLGMRRDQVFGWSHIHELGRSLGLEFKGRGQVAEDDIYGMGMADRMLFLDGLAVNRMQDLKEVWNDANEDDINWFELERFSQALKKFKTSRMLLDFNDMMLRFVKANPASLPKFKVLIVDEAQDLSSLQWDAVEMLSQNADEVVIAGDDDQSIYSWSGANVDKFIEMQGDVDTLPHTYRLPSSVYDFVRSITDKISRRREKTWSSRPEVGAVNWFGNMEEIDISKGSWLLLARNGYQLEAMEEWCLSQGFSFHSVNRDPLKSPALSAIRTWENLRRGNEQSASRILEVFRYLSPAAVPESLAKKLKSEDEATHYHMHNLRSLGLTTEKIWHEALTRIAPKERDFFLAARRRNEPLLKEPRINISTIHAAKGGQADHTLLLTDMSYRCYNNMEDNFDDEARVWYVAGSRCRETLNLVMPKTELCFDL